MRPIKQTAVRVGDAVFSVDTIAHEGALWLVPAWIELPGKKQQMPERIIRLDEHRLQKPTDMVFDYVLTREIPPGVLDGQTTTGFEVVVRPEILVEIPSASGLDS